MAGHKIKHLDLHDTLLKIQSKWLRFYVPRFANNFLEFCKNLAKFQKIVENVLTNKIMIYIG